MEKGLTFIFKADSSMEKQSKEKLLNGINILQTSAQMISKTTSSSTKKSEHN